MLLQALLGSAPLRRTSQRAALGAPRGAGTSRTWTLTFCLSLEHGDCRLAPFNFFLLSALCVYWWLSACLKRVRTGVEG